MADLSAALSNLERAFSELESHQKLAPDSGLNATSPREALMAGAKLHLVTPEEAPHWSRMLLDRNLTSHTYNAEVADKIIGRLLLDYVPCFRAALDRVRTRLSDEDGPETG